MGAKKSKNRPSLRKKCKKKAKKCKKRLKLSIKKMGAPKKKMGGKMALHFRVCQQAECADSKYGIKHYLRLLYQKL